MILKIFATFLTGIGGHYLNRRWDKAILFLCLFLCHLAVAYFLMLFLLQGDSGEMAEMYKRVEGATRVSSLVLSIGAFVLWLISLFVTFRDGKRAQVATLSQWTISGIIGASLTTLLSTLYLLFAVSTFASTFDDPAVPLAEAYEDNSGFMQQHNFYTHIYLGGGSRNAHKFPAPPTGESTLKGQILYQGEPVAAVTLNLNLNSKYRAAGVVTDADGIFTVKLEPGEWLINSIQTESWAGKPEAGEFSMYYGGEERLRGNNYDRHSNVMNSGHPVKIVAGTEEVHLKLRISEDIDMVWPDVDIEKSDASITDTILWAQYPGAAQYYVKLSKLRREGDTTHYEKVTSLVLANQTEIPLSSLRHIETNQDDEEYSVEVFAFTEDGTLIAQSSAGYRKGTFMLTDGNILVKDRLGEFFGSTALADPEEFVAKMEAVELDKRRRKAVAVLIEDNLLTEAEVLLSLVDSEYSEGKKEVLTGYLFAMRGECEKAAEMFDQATVLNPDVCVPAEYRGGCE